MILLKKYKRGIHLKKIQQSYPIDLKAKSHSSLQDVIEINLCK